jgi:cytochrome c biogenesis protein CcmG/thiol:disulfide interchange protein DsbE
VGAEPERRGRAGALARAFGVACAVAFVALLAYGVVARSPDTTIDDALARRTAPAAPGFRLGVLSAGDPGDRLRTTWRRAARDGRVDLEELRGVPVVLNFWASWCDPCREEAPLLQRGWKAGRRQGVLFVGLNQQDAREDARNFLAEFGQDFPNVKDPSNETARRWGMTGIPETFFVTARGDVVFHVIGTLSAAQLRDGVAAARRGRPLGADRGGEQRPTR